MTWNGWDNQLDMCIDIHHSFEGYLRFRRLEVFNLRGGLGKYITRQSNMSFIPSFECRLEWLLLDL
jgi:hypothetical protein